MCGIAGKIYFDRERSVTPHELRAMANTMIHRGPDGEGVWFNENVGLAHRRLAIIDLRDVASQPMCNEDGSVWITFNGEIYNFEELREELERRGHIFRTHSDTEGIIHAYEEYGRQCLDKFRGMFAIGIWDKRKQTLFLARDRLGKKPIFYYYDKAQFLFASEIKALLANDTFVAQVDPVAIDHFLACQYIPAPLTAFRGVQKLPPAHWLELRNGEIEIGRYWKLRYNPKRNLTMRDAVEEFRWRFAEAVRLRLVSDVPLGAFLSGGVDSSAVVAVMAQEMGGAVNTFSVGFEEKLLDERLFARQVAERYGTKHTELVVKAPVTEILPKLVWHYDEPFGDASAVPSYAIAALTGQHITVALNGDGGDENFAGYEWYLKDLVARRGEIIPLRLRQLLSSGLQHLTFASDYRGLLSKIARLAKVLTFTPLSRYVYWMEHFPAEMRHNLYSAAFNAAVVESNPEQLFAAVLAASDAEVWVERMLDADVNMYLPEDLLVKIDRATMAHSVEARSPFLDHVLMEFIATLPSHRKLVGKKQKILLKKAFQGVLPDTVIRRPKMGFCVPLEQWLREDLREMAYDVLLSRRAIQRGYFRPKFVVELLDAHSRGKADHSKYLWDLLILELWHRTFLDGFQFTTNRLETNGIQELQLGRS